MSRKKTSKNNKHKNIYKPTENRKTELKSMAIATITNAYKFAHNHKQVILSGTFCTGDTIWLLLRWYLQERLTSFVFLV